MCCHTPKWKMLDALLKMLCDLCGIRRIGWIKKEATQEAWETDCNPGLICCCLDSKSCVWYFSVRETFKSPWFLLSYKQCVLLIPMADIFSQIWRLKRKGKKKSFQNINPTLKKHKQEMLKPRAWLPWQLGFAKLPSQRSGPLLGMVASQICFDHQICGSSQMYWKGKVDLARSHLLGASSTWQLLVPLCGIHLLPTDVLWGRQRRAESLGDGHREEHKGPGKNYWTVTRERC